MLAFILGLFAGSIIGVFITALAVASKNADDYIELNRFSENKDVSARDESNDQSPTK